MKSNWQFFKNRGCDYVQGYLLGRAMPFEAFLERFGPDHASRLKLRLSGNSSIFSARGQGSALETILEDDRRTVVRRWGSSRSVAPEIWPIGPPSGLTVNSCAVEGMASGGKLATLLNLGASGKEQGLVVAGPAHTQGRIARIEAGNDLPGAGTRIDHDQVGLGRLVHQRRGEGDPKEGQALAVAGERRKGMGFGNDLARQVGHGGYGELANPTEFADTGRPEQHDPGSDRLTPRWWWLPDVSRGGAKLRWRWATHEMPTKFRLIEATAFPFRFRARARIEPVAGSE